VRFASLDVFGIPQSLLALWSHARGPELTPFQVAAVRGGLLSDSGNLVVGGEPCAGKSVAAEMVATASATKGPTAHVVQSEGELERSRRAFARYAKGGLRIATLSVGQRLITAAADLLLVTARTMATLMIEAPPLLERLSAVVIDGLGTLGNRSFGDTERFLLFLRGKKTPPRIVAVSGNHAPLPEIAHWLDADLVVSRYRPSGTQTGVLYRGRFEQMDAHRGEEAEVSLGSAVAGPALEAIAAVVEHAIASDETILIVLPDPEAAAEMATRLAKDRTPEVASIWLRSDQREPTQQQDMLRELAKSGVALLHSGLTDVQREDLLTAFGEGRLRAVVASMELDPFSLPSADNVVTDGRRWEASPGRDLWLLRDIHFADLAHLARVARSSTLPHRVTRAMVLATSPFDHQRQWQMLRRPPVPPAIQLDRIDETVLSFIASGMAPDLDALAQVVTGSFSFRHRANDEPSPSRLRERLDLAITSCLQVGFAERVPLAGIVAPPLGAVVAAVQLPVAVGQVLCEWAARNATDKVLELEVLLLLCVFASYLTPSFELPPDLKFRDNPCKRVLEHGRTIGIFNRPAVRAVADSRWELENHGGVKFWHVALLFDWLDEAPVAVLEERFLMSAGHIHDLARRASSMCDTLADLCSRSRWRAAEVQSLRRLARRLQWGVRPDALDLLRGKSESGWRHVALKLRAGGYLTPASVASEPQQVCDALGSVDLFRELWHSLFGERELPAVTGPSRVTVAVGNETSEDERSTQGTYEEKAAHADEGKTGKEKISEGKVDENGTDSSSRAFTLKLSEQRFIAEGHPAIYLRRRDFLTLVVLSREPRRVFSSQELNAAIGEAHPAKGKRAQLGANSIRYGIVSPLRKAFGPDNALAKEIIVSPMRGHLRLGDHWKVTIVP
jgi:hypothetical protein